MANTDYPRMLFHRTKEPVTVHSREEEDALGPGWSRKIWPPNPAPDPAEEPEPESDPDSEPEPDEEPRPEDAAVEEAPAAPHRRPGRPPGISKSTKKKR